MQNTTSSTQTPTQWSTTTFTDYQTDYGVTVIMIDSEPQIVQQWNHMPFLSYEDIPATLQQQESHRRFISTKRNREPWRCEQWRR